MLNSGNAIFSTIWSVNTDIKKNIWQRRKPSITFEQSEFQGLIFDEYENKRKQLIKERNSDYNKYLREKEKQLELKRFTRKLQSHLNNNFETNINNSYNMLTSNNIFGFASSAYDYDQNRNGSFQFDSKRNKDDYRKALEQQMEEQRKRKEMEKLQEMQSLQVQSLYQPSFIDGSANRRPYLMKQENVPSAAISQSPASVDLSNQFASPLASVTPQITPVLPPPAVSLPPIAMNNHSGLLFESDAYKSKKKDYYRDDLKQQIEEKKRRIEEEKAREREEEERLAQRIEEQRLRMLQEYEIERQKKIQKEEELRKKQERLWQIQEQQKKEAEEARKLAYQKKFEEAEKMKMMTNLTSVSPNVQPPKMPPKIEAPPPAPQRPPSPPDPRKQVLNQLTQIRQQIHEEKKQKLEKLEQKKLYHVLDRPKLSSSSDSNNSDTDVIN
ncbi:centrosome and spindle pole-associated protein 1-like isoform X1 [Centruroides vittatus]|uniref:centrosome and spindle pole-associated protein 1-like isoform X1 n=2 Tax=Centruroides vittatus TaxID=120091 RepID=UPI00350EBE86